MHPLISVPLPPAFILGIIISRLQSIYLSSLFPWMRDRASAALLRHSSQRMRKAEHSASACPPPRQSETLLPWAFTHSDWRTQRTRDSRMPWQAGVVELASSLVMLFGLNSGLMKLYSGEVQTPQPRLSSLLFYSTS